MNTLIKGSVIFCASGKVVSFVNKQPKIFPVALAQAQPAQRLMNL